ncbi:AAA family ATPase, partial [Rhizobium johnstonii]|uniref:AAA family ATPase n=1 Tax=Rhizobium johnstonii TaxID=3019933 RepID=UPI003F9869D0
EAETVPCRGRVESLQWQIALRAIRLQCNFVVDWGVWSRAERDTCRQEARAAGARVVLCFLDVPFDALWDRVCRLNAELPAGSNTASFKPARVNAAL